jgi:ribosomal protein S30
MKSAKTQTSDEAKYKKKTIKRRRNRTNYSNGREEEKT